MTEISLRLSPKSEYHWEEVIPSPSSFEAYMRCYSGCASPTDVVGYTELLIQRIAPYCTNKDWTEYWTHGYSGLEDIDKRNGLRLTDTEKKLLDMEADILRYTEFEADIDRISENPASWNLPFSPLMLRRKILGDRERLKPAYKDVFGVEIKPKLSPEMSSKFDKIIRHFVDKGIIVIETGKK